MSMADLPFERLEEEVQKPHKQTEGSSIFSRQNNPLERMRVRMAAETYSALHTTSPYVSEDEGKETHPKLRKEEEPCGHTEKQLSCVIGVAVAVIVVLSVLLVVQHYQIGQTLKEPEEVCLSDTCVAVAGGMLEKMDLTAKPCDDFYQYACGSAINDPLIPPDKAKWNVFSSLYRRNEAILKRVLDEPGAEYKGKNSSAIQKAKTFFAACMNTSATEDTSTDVLRKIINDAGSWPVTSDKIAGTWNKESWNLEKTLIYTYLNGQGGLFDFGVVADDKNSSITKITFAQAGLTLGDYSSYLSNNTRMKKMYIDYFVEVAELLGAKPDEVEEKVNDVWDFEYRLAELFMRPDEMTDPTSNYHAMTLADLQNDLMKNVINLQQFLEGIFGEKIPLSEPILVPTPQYFTKMAKLVQDTEPATLASYLVWQLVQSNVPYMPTPFRLANQKVSTTLYGTTAPQLWITCVSRTSSVLGFAVGALYVQKAFAEESKSKVEMILDDIQQTFQDSLPHLAWMDDATREKALIKAKAVIRKIAYPEFVMNPVELDDHYKNLTVHENEPFQNILRARSAALNRSLQRRGHPPDKKEWSMVPSTVNAYYSPEYNEIVFPAGILQNPFFDPRFPMAVNYGGIGSIIGHELTHGFDVTGSEYDEHGNMHNWWTEASKAEFHKRTDCLVGQYSKFTVGKAHLNGITTLGENIADNGGVKTAYKAYQGWLERNDGVDARSFLPGLNMTTDQLYFLGFGQIWCAHYTPQYALRSLMVDSHSYAKYRVIGSLRNDPKFSEAYNCPVGSQMNPEQKCSVW